MLWILATEGKDTCDTVA